MTDAEIQGIIDKISYRSHWELIYSWNKNDRYIQWKFLEGVHDGPRMEPKVWYCRKWRISTHMTPSEIIQTAFMAALAAEEHECRERFLYKGVAVLGPHWDLEEKAENIIHGYVRESVRT